MQNTYIANPVAVHAAVILAVQENAHGALLTLHDGREYQASAEMLARYTPMQGDYLMTEEDSFEHVNPKDLFERKYRPMQAREATDGSSYVELLAQQDRLQRELSLCGMALLKFSQKSAPQQSDSEQV